MLLLVGPTLYVTGEFNQARSGISAATCLRGVAFGVADSQIQSWNPSTNRLIKPGQRHRRRPVQHGPDGQCRGEGRRGGRHGERQLAPVQIWPVAAYDTANTSASLNINWHPVPAGSVRSLAAAGSTAYTGSGSFTEGLPKPAIIGLAALTSVPGEAGTWAPWSLPRNPACTRRDLRDERTGAARGPTSPRSP